MTLLFFMPSNDVLLGHTSPLKAHNHIYLRCAVPYTPDSSTTPKMDKLSVSISQKIREQQLSRELTAAERKALRDSVTVPRV